MSSEKQYHLEADSKMIHMNEPRLSLLSINGLSPGIGSERGQSVEAQLTSISAGSSSFIDPEGVNDYYYCDDYDDYATPCDDKFYRLDRSQVELVQMIGEGQKGFVFLGKLQSRDGRQMIDVAIKTLKYETNSMIDKLMQEAAMMRQFEHPHIIKFIGVCPETPALIAMELAKFGELKQYLKANRSVICVSQLVLFTFQISTALSYLESKQFVHRDVAARNILVCSHSCVKLADFGLSRNLQPELPGCQFISTPRMKQVNELRSNCLEPPSDLLVEADDKSGHYVSISPGKLPVRWLAPESLAFRRFTSASDVWMFAVCTWEVFHFGQIRPWPSIRNNQVLLAIGAGQRLSRPPNCPARLYQLMLQCWSYAPAQRPKFRDIKQNLWSIYLNERAREQSVADQIEKLEEHQRQQQILAMATRRQFEREQHVINLINSRQQHQNLFPYRPELNYQSRPCRAAVNDTKRASSTKPQLPQVGWTPAQSKSVNIGWTGIEQDSRLSKSPTSDLSQRRDQFRAQKSQAENTMSTTGWNQPWRSFHQTHPSEQDKAFSCFSRSQANNSDEEANEADEHDLTGPVWARSSAANASYEGLQPVGTGWQHEQLGEAVEGLKISASPKPGRIQKQQERGVSLASQQEDNSLEKNQIDIQKQREKEKEQRNRLALHQRLLGHIRLPSNRDRSDRNSHNLSVQSTADSRLSPNMDNKPKSQVESVEQSLKILASLISDDTGDSRLGKTVKTTGSIERNRETDNESKKSRPKSCEYQMREQWKKIGLEFAKRQANARGIGKALTQSCKTNIVDLRTKESEKSEQLKKSQTALNLYTRDHRRQEH